jgi:universal stress protein E
MPVNPLKSILVGIDFSDCSESTLFQAARLAKSHQAILHVFHVVDQLVLRELQDVLSLPTEQVEEQVRTDCLRDMEKLIAKLDSAPEVQVTVAFGSPLDEIIRQVKAVSAGLLVLGTRGGSSPSTGTGTLAMISVRKVPTQVMLVRPSHLEPFRTVVVCVDFSDISSTLVHHAAQIARNDGSQLHLLHVFAPPWQRLHYMAPTPQASPYFRQEYLHALKARLESYLEALPEDLRQGLQVQCELVQNNNYAYGILDYTRDSNADLVVLGNKGRTNLRYIFLGSTAERVVQNTACSLLAIKPDDSVVG